MSRIGTDAGYTVPAGAVERGYREHGVNCLSWGSRRSWMGDALRG